MDEQPQSYRREFLKSPHHAALGLLTLGLGFISAQIIGLVAGATCYALGWIYLPDLPLFRNWVNRKQQAGKDAEEARRIAEFAQKREAMLASLTTGGREHYRQLAAVCRDIEQASAEGPLGGATDAGDPRLRKLDELMWTYLRLLSIEQSLRRFLETENDENVVGLLKQAEAEAAELAKEVEETKAKGNVSTIETRQRYLGSRLERLEVLRKRQERNEQAQANLALVLSEEQRLEDQIKLIRADAVATKNADALTARIDATVEHLDQTNKWLAEMAEFKDLGGDLPTTDRRLGYEATGIRQQPPPIIESPRKPREATRARLN